MTVEPVGMDAYRDGDKKKQWREHPDVVKADAVSIYDVLRDYFKMEVPWSDTSYKVYCPFGEDHADGGKDKGMRVYSSSNSAYCFSQHGVMTPVRLVMTLKGMGEKKAAQHILQRYGIPSRMPWRNRYAEVMMEQERKEARQVNPTLLVEALHVALASESRYLDMLFSKELNDAIEVRLAALDALIGARGSEEEVWKWYQETLEQLRKLLSDGET